MSEGGRSRRETGRTDGEGVGVANSIRVDMRRHVIPCAARGKAESAQDGTTDGVRRQKGALASCPSSHKAAWRHGTVQLHAPYGDLVRGEAADKCAHRQRMGPQLRGRRRGLSDEVDVEVDHAGGRLHNQPKPHALAHGLLCMCPGRGSPAAAATWSTDHGPTTTRTADGERFLDVLSARPRARLDPIAQRATATMSHEGKGARVCSLPGRNALSRYRGETST